MLSEESDDSSTEAKDKEHALANAVDAMVSSMAPTRVDFEDKREKHREYEQECREKFSTPELEEASEVANKRLEAQKETKCKSSSIEQTPPVGSASKFDKEPFEEVTMLGEHRKVTVLYELLSACLADLPEDNKKKSRQRRRGYDARHRVALRLLATWFNVKWIKMVCFSTSSVYIYIYELSIVI